jgi:hypothetical protein
MSLVDDRSAEIDAQLLRAWEKCRYGKRYSPAYDLALEIKTLRQFLSERNHSAADRLILLWSKVETTWLEVFEQEAGLDVKEWYDIRVALRTAWILLTAAITTSKKLREIADALDAEPGDDPRQANIFKAYTDCINGKYPPTIAQRGKCFVKCYLPTLTQLRDAFAKRFGEECWPGNFSVRKTLRVLGLELNKAKRGRPIGSRSIIHNRTR